jgi:hypothetical protein
VAKGGGKRRSYVRDGRGRFASTPGGGGPSGSKKPARKGRSASTGRPQPRTFRQRGQAQLDRRPGQGGYLGKATKEAKARLKAAKAKLKASPSAQQRAAVTRAQIRAEGASPATRLKRSGTPGTLKGAKGRRMKPGAAGANAKKTSQKVLTPERIKSANDKLKTKLTEVLNELRKVDNAKSRDNSPMSPGSGFSPRYQKLIAREVKAGRQLESLRKAAKKLKQIELIYTPEKYGFARGTSQRKALASEIRAARGRLMSLRRGLIAAEKAYKDDPVVKHGLWGEIGQNRRQSRKAKERKSTASMNRGDRYIGYRIATREQEAAIKQLREKAAQQTRETNRRRKPST